MDLYLKLQMQIKDIQGIHYVIDNSRPTEKIITVATPTLCFFLFWLYWRIYHITNVASKGAKNHILQQNNKLT